MAFDLSTAKPVDSGGFDLSTAKPVPAPSLGDQIRNYAGGLEQSLYDLPQSALELGARGTDALGLTNNAYNTLHNEFQGARQFEGDPTSRMFKGGELVGNVAATAPMGTAKIPEAAAAYAPKLAKVANGALAGMQGAALTSAGSDAPLSQQLATGMAGGALLPTGGLLLSTGGKIAKNLLGATTGAGANSIEGAFNAGLAGGDKAAAFKAAMNDPSTWGSVVQDAKQALSNLRQQRSNAYKSGMVDVKNDKSILSFDPVDTAMQKASGVKNFAGKDLDPDTADVRAKVSAAIDDWKSSDPATYHTPEGFDALKQLLGNMRDNYQHGSPAWKVANDAYSAVRNTVADQAPTYNKVMSDYHDASDQLSELQRELSLGPKGNPNTALRKLQSVMRDNVNTSWGKRAQLANDLADAGASNLMPSLAGQALSSPLPRGLARWGDPLTAATVGIGGALTGGPAGLAAAAPVLAASSPRLMGNLAYGAGALGRRANTISAALPSSLPRLNINSGLGALAPQLLLQTAP